MNDENDDARTRALVEQRRGEDAAMLMVHMGATEDETPIGERPAKEPPVKP